MMTKEDYLKQYKNYQSMRDNVAKDPYRLHYHLMPPTGFLNDPNGLCQNHGTYHIYFQYTPFDCGWGTKLWGHYTTQDMITFKQEEPFLFPDQQADRDGVYSGSAFIENNTIHYFYTGNVKLMDRDDYDYIQNGREQNTIHMTSQDGYSLSKKEVVLTNHDYPADMSAHVRDPKIFQKGNDYYMVLGARSQNNKGCVLMYRSHDFIHFDYYNRIETPDKFGYMWECPDLFELDGQLILMVCPQGVEQIAYDYANVYQTGYYPIDFDFDNNTYQLGEFKELDRGFDIYAPQSFIDEKGRRIQLSWMGIPDASYHNQPTILHDWQHALTMPRVLSYQDNQIVQQPLEELKQLRKSPLTTSLQDFNQHCPTCICYEMKVEFDNYQEFNINIRDDVQFIYQNNVLTLSLGESGCGRTNRSVQLNEITDFTIYSDTSSIEIFVNGGKEVFTTRVYSQMLQQKVHINSHNNGQVNFYELSGYHIEK